MNARIITETQPDGDSVQLFRCYAHVNEALCSELRTRLVPLQRAGLVSTWYARQIDGGD